MKLKPIALGVSFGVVWGGALFIVTLLSHFTGYGKAFLDVTAVSLYPGYSISVLGSFVGLVYGFIDFFIGGVVISWLYNKIAKS